MMHGPINISIALAFIFYVVDLIQSYSVMTPPQSAGHRGSILDKFKT